jgi:hypothetical protein
VIGGALPRLRGRQADRGPRPEDLLDMSRIISGRIRLDVQRVSIADVVTAAIQSVQPSADVKGVRLRTVLDPHAGPVAGDVNRLQQVVWNELIRIGNKRLRYRRGNRARISAALVRAVPVGGRVDYSAPRRLRTRPQHCKTTGRITWRNCPSQKSRFRPGKHFYRLTAGIHRQTNPKRDLRHYPIGLVVS